MSESRFGDFSYAEKLAMDHFPEPYQDEYGYYEELPHSFSWFMDHFDTCVDAAGVTKDDFFKQDSIIPVLEAYGLDKEKFWRVTIYIHNLTSRWAKHKELVTALPEPYKQLQDIREGIKDVKEFKIVVSKDMSSRSIKVEGRIIRSILLRYLDQAIENKEGFGMHEIPVWRTGTAKLTEMTWYAANLFTRLFESLELPIKRSRSVEKVYRTKYGKDYMVSGRDAEVSYDKNQLIAELIIFLGLTENENLDGNSIKGILAKKEKFFVSNFV